MDDVNKFKHKLEAMESRNEILGINLVTVDQEREQISNHLYEDVTSCDWNRGLENFEKLRDNSDRIVHMMKDQNKITQDILSTTRGTLKSLESTHKSLENTHLNTKFL